MKQIINIINNIFLIFFSFTFLLYFLCFIFYYLILLYFTKSKFISYIKLKERIKQIQKINKYNSQQIIISNEDELYNFNYIIHKKLDIKDFDIMDLEIFHLLF